MRVLPTNNRVLIAYVHAVQQKARNPRNSLSFIGDELNSYDSSLARINRTDEVLFINSNLISYSVTTTAHISALKTICEEYRIFTIPFDKQPLQVVQWYCEQIEKLIPKCLRAKKYKEMHKNLIYITMAEVEDYVDYMQIDQSSPEYLYKTNIVRQLFKHKLLKA